MDSVEAVGKTLEEAIEEALKRLGAKREEVEIQVIEPGRAGLLGFGAREAKVRVVRKAEPAVAQASPVASRAKEVLEGLLSAMKVSATVTLQEGPPGERPLLHIRGQDAGLLIGRRGDTLQALQFLLNLVLSRRLDQPARVTVDVEGYRRRRYRALRNLARRVAQRVVLTGQPITLEPMPPNERRIIHLALSRHPKVTTESSGEGEKRKITVMPREGRRQ